MLSQRGVKSKTTNQPTYLSSCLSQVCGVVGYCAGTEYTSSAGASYNLDYGRARAYCTCSRCGWGCLHVFILIYPFSPLSLWETVRYRLIYCLKGPLSPKQPTNHLAVYLLGVFSCLCVCGCLGWLGRRGHKLSVSYIAIGGSKVG